jgi:hypothetical protein
MGVGVGGLVIGSTDGGWGSCGSCYTTPMKQGLYANINRRKKLGISRPKSESTIKPRIWKLMKAKKGGFEASKD